MTPASRVNIDDLPDSPYARELRLGVGRLEFDPALETQYVTAHVGRVKLRARTWFALSAALSILFTVSQTVRHGLWNVIFWLHCCTVVPISLALASLVWSRHYERRFLSVARLLVPVNLALIAAFVAHDLGSGRQEEIAALSLNLVAAFFFMGLMYRAALLSVVGVLASFALSIVASGLVSMMALRNLVALVLTAVISAIVARDVERSMRRGFLEGALIAEMVSRDGLSGLMNRRALDEHLLRVWQQAQRDRRTLALLMIDIDHFKAYNDTFGHQSGDAAIRAVAHRLGGFARRPLDLAARYGGEEFVILLYDLSPPHVADIAERLRETVQNLRLGDSAELHGAGSPGAELPTRAAAGGSVTVSIGAAVVTPALGRNPQGAMQLADEALYEAKKAGRNRVVLRDVEDHRVLRTGHFKMPANAGRWR